MNEYNILSYIKLYNVIINCSLTVHPYPSYGYQSSNNNDDVDLDVDDGIDDSDERESHQVMSSSATSPFKRLRNNSFSVDSNVTNY